MSVPLPRRHALAREVARSLIAYVHSGTFAAGQKLPSERKLSEILGVGRSKVREAMKSIELLGLVEQHVGDGTYLARSGSDLLPDTISWGLLLGEHETEHLLEMRRVVAVPAAGWAAERRSAKQLARLHELLDELTESTADAGRFTDADAAFHRQIADASGNRALSGTVANVHSLLLVLIGRTDDTGLTLSEYKMLLEAVDARDAAMASAAMADHVDRVARKIRALASAPTPPEPRKGE